MPKVVETATALIDAVCPYDCPAGIVKRGAVWIESRGLGQQMHADASANLLFHLHGNRQVILAPPDEVLRHAHLHPHFHPNSQGQPAQSQLAWSREDWSRSVAGYGLPQNEQTPPPRYDQTKETVAHLTGGDLLYVPAYWGQQTCAGMSEATISLLVTLWPTAVGPDDRAQDRGPWGSVLNPEHPDSKRSERQNKALREALEKAVEGTQTAAEKWVRFLGSCPSIAFTHIVPARIPPDWLCVCVRARERVCVWFMRPHARDANASPTHGASTVGDVPGVRPQHGAVYVSIL